MDRAPDTRPVERVPSLPGAPFTPSGDCTELLRLATQRTPLNLFAQDRELRYVWVHNTVGARAPTDVIGLTDDAFFAPDDARRVTTLKRRVMVERQAVRETIAVTMDGAEQVFDLSLSPWYGADGQIRGVLGAAFDVTALRRAERDAHENQMRYKSFVDAFDGLVYDCTRDFRIAYMNRALIERSGRDGTGEVCYRVLHDRETPCPWCVNDRVFAGETVRWEVQSPKDGRWFHVVNTPVRLNGAIQLKQAIISDITEQRRATAEREAMQARMDRLQRMDSLSRMAGGIAHHFNNQLMTILGNVELMLDDARMPADLLESLRDVYHAGRKCAQISGMLLQYTGRLPQSGAFCDINDVVAQAAGNGGLSAAAAGRLVLRLTETLPPAAVGAEGAKVVIEKLLANAWEAMEGRAGDIVIETACVSRRQATGSIVFEPTIGNRDAYVAVRIGDQGCGMRREVLERLFEPFFSTKLTGRGLGLALVHGLVRATGGFISVASEPERGSTFSVHWPVFGPSVNGGPQRP